MKFLLKNFTKRYKFWIKSVVLYPKMYIWFWKNKKIVLFTLKMKFLPKNFTNIWSWKTKKFVLFTLKMKFLPKNFTKMYKFWIKTVVLYPKMYIWSWKNKKIVLFTLKMKFLPKNFTKMYKFWIKTSFVPKNKHFVLKNKKKMYFLH